MKISKEEALEYHRLNNRPGKLEVIPTKPLVDQRDLCLAYTPGVAYPVLEIEKYPQTSYDYTNRANLVAVISNGTAILGLGNRGALAAKPVMEGKGVLFKKFANIDVYDLEVNETDPDSFIKIVAALAPTFGGINLEDIKSPDCFTIEQQLQNMLDIPVFHDDQHGTAIILAAALLNALEIIHKDLNNIKVVFSGAGAAGLACAKQIHHLGVPKNHIWMCDVDGLVYEGRKEGMFEEKSQFAMGQNPATLAAVIEDADVFIGLSVANILTAEMIKKMCNNPIIFAMANPDPEISYETAQAVRPDAIVATGRSDYPNQINNVLGFPFIFRGALDTRASAINQEMKIAASKALAELAHEPVPQEVLRAYHIDHLEFGKEYLVPKPLDTRVLIWESLAVAKAAVASSVARQTINLDEYKTKLELLSQKA
ncbi:MAG: malic enzyme-like NAD(P)-binding protein [Anaerolineaceae bacterium]